MDRWMVSSKCSPGCIGQGKTIRITRITMLASQNLENMWIRYDLFIASYYRQLSTDIKIDNYKIKTSLVIHTGAEVLG